MSKQCQRQSNPPPPPKGGPHGGVDSLTPFDHLTVVSGVGSSSTQGTCETNQKKKKKVLLACVAGVFSRGSSVFAPPSDWFVSYELK